MSTFKNRDPVYTLVAVARYADVRGTYTVYLQEGHKYVDGRRVRVRKNGVAAGDEGLARLHDAFALYIGPWTKFGLDLDAIPEELLFIKHHQILDKAHAPELDEDVRAAVAIMEEQKEDKDGVV